MIERINQIEQLTERLNESEAQLKESLSMYKALSDSTFEAVFIIIDGVCVEANKAAYEILGLKKEDIIGKNPAEFVHPDYRKTVEKNTLSHVSIPFEAVAIKKDGTEINIEIQSKSVEFLDKKITTVVAKDITDQKKSQESVLRLLELWESTFNSITDMISLHNMNFEIIEVNDAFRRKFGNSCLGKKCFELIHNSCDESSCKFLKYFNKLKLQDMVERKSFVSEVEFQKEEWYEVTCSPIISNGGVVGIVHIMKDISQRKMFEEKIIRSNELYKNLIDATSVAILVYEDCLITDVNSAFLRLFEYESKDQLLYKRLQDIGFSDDSVNVLHKKVLDDEKRKFTIALTTKTNEVKFVDIRVRRFTYGEKHGVIAVTIDPVITEEKRRESDNV